MVGNRPETGNRTLLTLPEARSVKDIRTELARYRRSGDCGYVIDCIRMHNKDRTPAQVNDVIAFENIK